MSSSIRNHCVWGTLPCLLLVSLLVCGCDVKPKTGKGEKGGTKKVGVEEKITTLQNMKYLLLAMHKYHDTYKVFPPAYTVDASGKPLHSWRVLVLPYIEQKTLYDQIRLDEPWDSEHNKQFHNRDVATFHSGAVNSPKGFTDFSMVVGTDTVSDGPTARKLMDITDGISKTILFVERATPVCWMEPTEVTQEAAFQGIGASPDGIAAAVYPSEDGRITALVGLCDGSATQIFPDVPPEQIQAALSRASGKSVSFLW